MAEPTKKFQTGQNEGYTVESEPKQRQQQQLAPIMTDQVDKEELLEEYKSLISYKTNQNKLNTLLSMEKDQETLEELKGMSEELIEVIAQQEEKIKSIQNNDNFTYNTESLQEEDLGRLAKAYYENDNKWYHSQIVSIDTDEQMAEIQFIGYKDIISMHSIYIKLFPKPNPEGFIVGTNCEAIYSDDGKYYPCQIEKIEDEKYTVRFKKYNNKETVTIYHLRESRKAVAQQGQNKKKQFDDLTEFKVPENLKILPNDTEQQRTSKKKKIKALKQQFKQAQIEKESQDKQDKWNSFKKNKTKYGAIQGQSRNSIFKTSDRVGSKVGVMNSGQGMTNFGLKDRLLLEDNSHLSRQF